MLEQEHLGLYIVFLFVLYYLSTIYRTCIYKPYTIYVYVYIDTYIYTHIYIILLLLYEIEKSK